eukprot:CAMPEP_0169408820 /NCGR_PEP_ID=MMETSP1017-20121227/58910_1 /TAXON_ID=342587 /ORGANISM="Karlodinium micrum, Strain CCMP2283" /LENGTH=194 /DNA_ID=CAMNT_0009515961 /DNA_START=12 /DNA_END=596 /DNA_ORIENTATION=+
MTDSAQKIQRVFRGHLGRVAAQQAKEIQRVAQASKRHGRRQSAAGKHGRRQSVGHLGVPGAMGNKRRASHAATKAHHEATPGTLRRSHAHEPTTNTEMSLLSSDVVSRNNTLGTELSLLSDEDLIDSLPSSATSSRQASKSQPHQESTKKNIRRGSRHKRDSKQDDKRRASKQKDVSKHDQDKQHGRAPSKGHV